jgi:hypothetical protein
LKSLGFSLARYMQYKKIKTKNGDYSDNGNQRYQMIYIQRDPSPENTALGRILGRDPKDAITYRDADNGESATRWLVFQKRKVTAEYGSENFIDDLDALISDVRCEIGFCETYSGPGGWYWDGPTVSVTRALIIIRQHGGYDV